jgi:putative membrane protein (TIGR04086 family)
LKYDKSSRAENPMMDALKAIVLGACFGAVFCMIGLIACALVFMGAKSIPYQMIQQIVLVICGLGALLSGYLCVRISRKNGLLFGFLAALLLFLLMLLVSAAAIQEPLTQQSLLRGLLMVIAGAIGGVIGVNKKSKRR